MSMYVCICLRIIVCVYIYIYINAHLSLLTIIGYRHAVILPCSLVCEKPRSSWDEFECILLIHHVKRSKQEVQCLFTWWESWETPLWDLALGLWHCVRKTKQALTNVISPLFPKKKTKCTRTRGSPGKATHIL